MSNCVIIAGSRGFTDYPMLCRWLDALHKIRPFDEVVSGGARGADRMGEQWAKSRGVPVKRFLADWDRLGKRAGFARNAEMAEYANGLVAFWDSTSPGTRDMIVRMHYKIGSNVWLKVVDIKDQEPAP